LLAVSQPVVKVLLTCGDVKPPVPGLEPAVMLMVLEAVPGGTAAMVGMLFGLRLQSQTLTLGQGIKRF
jgi:hypothetical protein